ncbi:Crp/Fnr family transcriptional regulator [Aureibacter tunicatorum]|uniref:CRP-like cAMP-binding protein n=1 Tax=Aureibacter tunicatorum TaxID=866807 RepID=A0AAE3XMF6_9BACT|nr:cyclic nucleotide-binding domain-containing protein [Aureibacter tunicatorum]MDR6237664.1 CRP-like cAMP-binding protein [Aureibacter tunicatorum]BDD02699.1 hypothetical protein AUTU_01820 [Aureibacter tunicatorum]
MLKPFRLQKKYTDKELASLKFLSKVSLFNSLTYKEMEAFLPFLYSRDYIENEAIFFRNDPSNGLYIVKEGEVSLSYEIGGELEEVQTVSSHKAFGDNALLGKAKRIYNAVVKSKGGAVVIVIPKVNILRVFEKHPKIEAKMMKSLCSEYNDYTYKLFDAYKKTYGFFNLKEVYQGSEK